MGIESVDMCASVIVGQVRVGTYAEFPLVNVMQMVYDVANDILTVATLGRSVYRLTGAKTVLALLKADPSGCASPSNLPAVVSTLYVPIQSVCVPPQVSRYISTVCSVLAVWACVLCWYFVTVLCF